MLGMFRRFTKSKLGAVVAFAVLAIIAFAFAAGDVTGLGGGGGMSPKIAADVGDERISETELVTAAKNSLRQIQLQQPTADMAGLIAQNGVERLLDQLIDSRAIGQFAADQGMVISDRAVDGVIAGFPAFRGPDGKFSQSAYQAMLSQQRVPEQTFRADIARERLIQFLTAPANGGARVPTQYALPYASLLLERRRGSVALIPAGALPQGAAPTDAEIAAFYRANQRRYTVPERRAIRYAVVTPESVLAASAPTEAELQAAFKTEAARFAATERRTVQVAVTLDQASANALAARVRAGAALDAAAQAVGLQARTLTSLDKAAVATQTSQAVANAVFGASANAVVGPIRGGGGFTVARVTAIQAIPAKTFAQARAELLPEVTKANQAARIARLNDALDAAAAEGATFDEMVRAQKLTPLRTPALMQNGRDPLNLAAPADPKLAEIVQAGFGAEPGDTPQIVPVGQSGGFALVALESVLPAAPRPLAEIRADVARAVQLQRAQAAARRIAAGIVAKLDAGTPLAAALAQAGVKLPPAKPVDVPRAALAASGGRVDPALALMFSMAAKRAKMLELPGGGGWAVVWLDTIVPGDARRDPRTLAAAQGDLNRVAGRELTMQFVRAMREAVGVKRNPEAVARAKADLSGRTPDAQP